MNQTMRILSSHKSIRKFTNRPVEKKLLHTIVKTAQCASSSNNVQAYTVINITDRKVRKQMAQLAGPQPWVDQAPVFLVFCADLTRVDGACEYHGHSPEQGWTEQFIIAVADTAIFAQNLVVAAESNGLGAVFIGGIRNDPDMVCELLKIPDHACPVFGLCIGWPGQNPETKPRLPLELVLKQDTFNGKISKERTAGLLQDYDRAMQAYYETRNPDLAGQTWRSQMADFMSCAARPHMKSFLEKKGFFLK